MLAVALFTRAWIEINSRNLILVFCIVALFTRAWIEISIDFAKSFDYRVALFTRAWIEINACRTARFSVLRRPLHEGVD